jgi:hypothetical protein
MVKILTAIGNPKLNEKLSKEEAFNVVLKDIQYQEALIECDLETMDVKWLVISNLILGDIDFAEFLSQIRIKKMSLGIIVFLKEENTELRNKLNNAGIKYVFDNNSLTYDELKEIMAENNLKNETENKYKADMARNIPRDMPEEKKKDNNKNIFIELLAKIISNIKLRTKKVDKQLKKEKKLLKKKVKQLKKQKKLFRKERRRKEKNKFVLEVKIKYGK